MADGTIERNSRAFPPFATDGDSAGKRGADQSHVVPDSHQRANLDYKVGVSLDPAGGEVGEMHSTIGAITMFSISVQHSTQ